MIILSQYCAYKTPQWTDTYLLNYTHQRTTQQNVITYLSSAVLIYQFGPVGATLASAAGEYLAGTANAEVNKAPAPATR